MTRARWAVAVAVACLAAPAHADDAKSVRKPVSAQVAKAAGEAFARAITADEEGDLPLAVKMYERAFKISPHANTAYNLADVSRRANQLDDAAHYFEMYLALSPKAPDRDDVVRLIKEIRATPGTVLIWETPIEKRETDDTFSFETTYFFIDGTLAFKPGAKPVKRPTPHLPVIAVPRPAGKYVGDAISAVSYDQVIQNHCVVVAGRDSHCIPHLPPRVDGNVVLSSNEDAEFRVKREGDDHDLLGRRIVFKPGKHWISITDRRYECAPLLVDAPADDSVRYIFLRVTEDFLPPRCRAFQVEQQRLTF